MKCISDYEQIMLAILPLILTGLGIILGIIMERSKRRKLKEKFIYFDN